MLKLCLTLFCLLIFAVFGVAAQDDAPQFQAIECPIGIPAGFTLRCGTVEVPESRDAPESTNRIALTVVVMESQDPDPLPDPVIYLHGGPGGHSLESLDFLASGFAPFAEHRDVIFYDQRGVGFSGALDCPEYGTLGYDVLAQKLDIETLMQETNDVLLTCAKRLSNSGVDLTAYTTRNSAADLRDIVQALGYEQVNLVGISYGTKLALETMRDYPEMLRSVILDAVLPLQASPDADLGHNTNRVFRHLFDACAADAACNATYPDLEQVFYDTVARLKAKPEVVSAFDPYTGQKRDVLVDDTVLIYGLFDYFYQTPQIKTIPDFIYRAQSGDYTAFIQDDFYTLYEADHVDETLFMAVHCNEEIPFDKTVTGINDGLPPALADIYGPEFDSVVDYCAQVPAPPLNPAENEAVHSDVPTLVTVGDYDPVTPPAWAQEAASTLSHSYFYEFRGVGHAAFASSDCAQTLMTSFIDDPAQTPDGDCVQYLPPPLFAVTDVTAVNNQPFDSQTLGFSGLVPEGWFEFSPGLFSPYPGLRDPSPLLAYRFPDSVEQYVNDVIVNGYYGYDSLPEPLDNLEVNGMSWRIYQLQRGDVYTSFAMHDDPPVVIAVVAPDEATRDLLNDALFIQALDAFQLKS